MRRFAIILALAATPAFAQQQPDPAFLQKAVAALETQRNAALNAQVMAEVRAATLAEENAALKKQVEDLTKAAAAPK